MIFPPQQNCDFSTFSFSNCHSVATQAFYAQIENKQMADGWVDKMSDLNTKYLATDVPNGGQVVILTQTVSRADR